ncbi:NRDE family protein [Tamlana sp. 2_MG-2023]|uniref:NRDE family protein n=1 Tax=unclassified Tamlana TaxID=2614803 RepID=UPI0026E35E67|nr:MULTISPECIES: NRDE family protein [unclassified Tamlana]MDO6758626.1 NRDE family protein [Tamlana sp. 2_MG-2023]MDO6789325.1 NRDE family protein [Tamlana sp. 1_MG-2023]
MCTVTIIPTDNQNFVLTSNRDEASDRVALAPKVYDVNGVKLMYPKDELSGGTWIGVSEKKRLICVLNGGYVLHERKASYRKSRGIVAKDLMLADTISSEINNYDFSDIEPFTIIIADWNFSLKFYELVWDGEQAHLSELPLEPKIWSSSTLYTEAMKKERQDWFKIFQTVNHLNATNILKFHKTTGKENTNYGVIMDRGFVKTTSITQVEKQEDTVTMRFESVENQKVYVEKLNFKETLVNE